MGLFDEAAKGFAGKLSGEGAQNTLLDSALGLINNPETGGLAGLVQTFKDKGLGDVVSSWVSTGKNLPVSGEQIQNWLGNDQIRQIAEKIGISNEEISNGLANLLPECVDKLTPNGTLPEGGLLNQGLDIFKKKFLGN